MKKRIVSLLVIFVLLFSIFIPISTVEAKKVWVSGYTRKDGTRVKGHYRNVGGSSSTGNNYYSGTNTIDYDMKSHDISTGISYYKNYINLYKNSQTIGTANVANLVYVHGYYNSLGQYVRPHYRTHANQFVEDNFSYLGISTLKPKTVVEKYNYVNSKNTSISGIENYLLHNIEIKVDYINKADKKSILLYAQSLNNKKIEPDNLIYTKFGYSELESTILSKFDSTGEITTELYLYDVLKNYGINVSSDMEWLFKYYVSILNLYQRNQITQTQVKNFADKFYKIFSVPSSLINEQVEMDLLQYLEYSNGYEMYEDKLYEISYIDFSYDWDGVGYTNNIETFKSSIYNIEIYSKPGIELNNYCFQLDFYKNYQFKSTLTSIYESGFKFYTLMEVPSEKIEQTILQDIILVLSW